VNALIARLDAEYVLDVQLLRKEFTAVRTTDPSCLQDWFLSHSYLTNGDTARIAGVSLRTVRRWKRVAGLPGARRRPPSAQRRPGPTLSAPPDWKAGDWLQDRYREGHGVRRIARSIRRSYTFTRRLLRRRGVVFRPAQEAAASTHPCCTRHWLLLNYVVRGLSLTASARQARVSKATMTSWLLRFQVRIRSAAESILVSRSVKR
jgi:hypothetical protein